jgi:hypothetical protein
MALKDWKKAGKLRWQQNIKGNIQNMIYIDRRMVPISYFGTKERLEYGVHIGYRIISDKSKTVDTSEYFKTKSAALKFAKSYMRKH